MAKLTIDQLRALIVAGGWDLTSDYEIQGEKQADNGEAVELTGTIYAAMSKDEISISAIEDWTWSVERGVESWPLRNELEGAVLVDDDGDELEAWEASYQLDKAIRKLADKLLVPNYDKIVSQMGGN